MNRLIVAWKRILHRKLYWCMLGVLLILTGIYALLPAKSQSTEIRVAVYLEDTSAYTTQFKEELDASASLYQFYYVDASTDVIRDVQAGDAECGFVLPDGFFSGYIAGSGEPKVSLYETSASTLSSAICETFFHYIFKVASPQILVDTIDDAALSEELKSRMQAYMNSDTIFRMSSVTDGAYDYKENTYRIQLPIYECTCLLVLFASLFSLMLFLQDQERGIYIALSGKRRYGILCTGTSGWHPSNLRNRHAMQRHHLRNCNSVTGNTCQSACLSSVACTFGVYQKKPDTCQVDPGAFY